MRRFLLLDVGCLDCHEPTEPISLHETRNDAMRSTPATWRVTDLDEESVWHARYNVFVVIDLEQLEVVAVGYPP